jgi:nucleotide-binding universal stress UspA family protein
MAYRDLLVHVDRGGRAQERVDLAVALARRLGARLTGLYAELATLGPSVVARRSPQKLAEARAAARALFDARTAAASLATGWWAVEPGEYGEVVPHAVACCRYVDLAILGQHEDDSAVPEEFVAEVARGAGRPVLVVPAFGHHADVGHRVLVAWNGSREAARALNDALPLLAPGATVTVMAFVEKALTGGASVAQPDVLAHLAAHGVAAAYEQVTPGDVSDGDGLLHAVLNRGYDLQADLTVVGLGPQGLPLLGRRGSARQLLETMTSPVLVSA